MAIDTQSDSVTATVSFAIPPPPGVEAFQEININPETGKHVSNYERTTHDITVENLRGKENSATLDTAGFQLYKKPTVSTFDDTETIEKVYYPEVIQKIKDATGASRVVLFDHTIRRRRPDQKEDSPEKRQPVNGAHVDQTPAAAEARVHRHLPAEEVPELLKHRYQLINLWRPINHPALEWPLALCDFRSVDADKDMLPIKLIYPDTKGETYGVLYNPEHKWKYFRGMTPDEFVLIKCFDSVRDGSVALFTPHTAFQDPTTPEGTPFRESIEVRALVFYD